MTTDSSSITSGRTHGSSSVSQGSGVGGSSGASSGLRQSLCAFWLGQRCFGLDVALVGEVVVIDTITKVPKAPSAVLGLFNLRGTPVPLVDASAIMDLDERVATGVTHALVVRHGDFVVALAIDRMDAVMEAGRGVFTAPTAGDEHPVVQGFLEVPERVVTVIAPHALLERLERLRPKDAHA